jgi:hypothetical protein
LGFDGVAPIVRFPNVTEAVRETFAREAQAGLGCIILLVLDNAGRHLNQKIPSAASQAPFRLVRPLRTFKPLSGTA